MAQGPAQPPGAHKNRHVSGGSDAFVSTDLLDAAVRNIRESGGATLLVGSVPDGSFLQRSGTGLIGTAGGTIGFTRVYMDTTATSFSNSAAENTMSTTTVVTPVQGTMYRFAYSVLAVNASVTARNCIHTAYIGTGAILTTTSSLPASSTRRLQMYTDVMVLVAGATAWIRANGPGGIVVASNTNVSASPITIKYTTTVAVADPLITVTNDVFIVESSH